MSSLRPAALVVACAASLAFAAFVGFAAFADDDATLCLECHEQGRWRVAEHPEGVLAAGMMRADSGLPLDAGRITCVTCHTFHGGGEPAADPGGRFWLRRTVPTLCAACHAGGGEWDRGHARYGDTIHGGVRLAPLDEPVADPAASSDDVSARCQACHANGHGGASAVNAGMSHPLKSYDAARARKWDAYTPPDRLDPAVRLVDGRVSCVSCHRLYGKNPAPYRLVVSDRKGQLCGRCHAAFS
jgi:predicted CXXCH cytochrome family protein